MKIDKATSLRMRGMGILLICLHNLLHIGSYVQECEFKFHEERVAHLIHGLGQGFWRALEYALSFWGWYGVPVFLFLSGYGLVCKYEKGHIESVQSVADDNGDATESHSDRHGLHVWEYLCHCFKKLFFLLAPAYLLFVALNAVREHISPTDILGQLTLTLNLYDARAIMPGVYWYFGLTMQLYIIYLFFHRFRSDKWLIVLSVAAMAIGIYFAHHEELTETHFQLRHNSPLWLPTFALGILVARHPDHPWLRLVESRWKTSICVLFVLWLYSSVTATWWVLSPLMAVSLIVLLCRHITGRALAWVGSVSAGIFVCHPILRVYALQAFDSGFNRLLVSLLFVAASITAGWAYMRVNRHAESVSKRLLKPLVAEWPMVLSIAIMLCFVHYMKWNADGLSGHETTDGIAYGTAFAVMLAYITACLIYLSKSLVVKVVVYMAHIIYFVVCAFLWMNFKALVSPTIIMLIKETTPGESGEFLNSYLTETNSLYAYGIVAAVVVLTVAIEAHRKSLAETLRHPLPSGFCMLLLYLLLTMGMAASDMWVKLFKCDSTDKVSLWHFGSYFRPADTVTDLAYSLWDIHLAKENVARAVEATRQASKATVNCTLTDSLDLVVVVGETYVKQHSQLYGYPLATNPHLADERDKGRLYVFTDAVSPYNMTSDVIKNVFSTNSIWNHEAWYDYPTFPSVFKAAGYHVDFWDNQRDFDTNSETTYALNSYLYDEDLAALSYDRCNDKNYLFDQGLVDSFTKQPEAKATHRLSILHLMGQHATATHRYPHTARYRKFNADSIRRRAPYLDKTKKTLIAHYDNATYYNDDTVWKLLQHYNDKNAVVVYFSDHGEELYDYRDHKGRAHGALDAKVLQYQFEVPFMIWVSDKYKRRHPEMADTLSAATGRPMSLDNVCQILFHIGGVESPYTHAERDALSGHYKPRKRLMRDEVYYEDLIVTRVAP